MTEVFVATAAEVEVKPPFADNHVQPILLLPMMNHSLAGKQSSSSSLLPSHLYDGDKSSSDETDSSMLVEDEESFTRSSMLGISLEDARIKLSQNKKYDHGFVENNHNSLVQYGMFFQCIYPNSDISRGGETTTNQTTDQNDYDWVNPSAFVFSTADSNICTVDNNNLKNNTIIRSDTKTKNLQVMDNIAEEQQKQYNNQNDDYRKDSIEVNEVKNNDNCIETRHETVVDNFGGKSHDDKECSSFTFILKSLSQSSSSSSSSSDDDDDDDNDECQKEEIIVKKKQEEVVSILPEQNQNVTKKKKRTLKKLCFNDDNEYYENETALMTTCNKLYSSKSAICNGMWQSMHQKIRKKKKRQHHPSATAEIPSTFNSHDNPSIVKTKTSKLLSSSQNINTNNPRMNQKVFIPNDDELGVDKTIQMTTPKKNVFSSDSSKQKTISNNDNFTSSSSSEKNVEEEIEKDFFNNKDYDDSEEEYQSINARRIQRQEQQAQYVVNKKNDTNNDLSDDEIVDSDDEIVDSDDSSRNDTITQSNNILSLTPCLSLQSSSTSPSAIGTSGYKQAHQRRRQRPHLKRLKQLSQSNGNRCQITLTDHLRRSTNRSSISAPKRSKQNPFQPTVRKRNQQLTQQSLTDIFPTRRK